MKTFVQIYCVCPVILIILCVIIYITVHANKPDTQACYQRRNFPNTSSFRLLPDITDEM